MGVISGGNVILGHPDEQYARTATSDPQTERGRRITVECLASAAGVRQGALAIEMNRAADQALTGWDGNPDCGLKIGLNVRSSNAASAGGARGLDVSARQRSTGVSTWVNAANIDARNDGVVSTVTGLQVRASNFLTVSSELIGINVDLGDESNAGSAHKVYGIRIRNTDASAQPVASAAIQVQHSATNGFAAIIRGEAATGDGFVASAKTPTGNAVSAMIVDHAGTLLYIPCYAVVGFGG